MTFPNTAQEQLFSIPKIPICGGGHIIKGCFCVWACCILWHADVFHNNKRLSNLLLWCHMTTTSIWILFCNILKTFVALSHGSVDAEDQEEWVFFPVCDYIYTWSSAASPQFCLKLIVPPFTVSFASSLWGLPSEPGTHYSSSWIQTLQSDASSTTWGFHSWKPL